MCPADGFASVTQFTLFFTNRTHRVIYRMQTTGGCGKGWQHFNGRLTTARHIASVRVTVDTATKNGHVQYMSVAFKQGDNPYN